MGLTISQIAATFVHLLDEALEIKRAPYVLPAETERILTGGRIRFQCCIDYAIPMQEIRSLPLDAFERQYLAPAAAEMADYIRLKAKRYRRSTRREPILMTRAASVPAGIDMASVVQTNGISARVICLWRHELGWITRFDLFYGFTN